MMSEPPGCASGKLFGDMAGENAPPHSDDQSANERVAIACTREIEHNSEQTNIVITVWPVANAVVTFIKLLRQFF